WLAATALIAWSAWQPPRRMPRGPYQTAYTIVLPISFAVVAIAVLLMDRIATTNLLALVLALATLVAVLVRLAVTYREGLRMLRRSERQARTDPLTGLGNRHQLMEDLERVLQRPDWTPPTMLALF